MTDKEKFGAAILVASFIIMGILLFFTLDRPEGELRSIENNIIVEQRMKQRDLN
jgi:hypothetical protein